MKNKVLIFNYGLVILLIFNFFGNLISKDLNIFFNNYDLTLAAILFVFIYLFSKHIRNALNLQYISLAIVLFVMSFFIFENIFQLIFSQYTFNLNFVVTNVFWIVFLKFRKIRFFTIFQLISNFIVLRIFTNFYFEKLTKNFNLKGDVKEYFFLNAKNIYENSYSYSIKNPVIEGYPQFSTYLQDIFTKFLLQNSEYVYLLSSTLILFFISFFILYEFIELFRNKILFILLYFSLILNSDFLQFLFTSSLMSEGIISVLTAVIFFNLSNFYHNNNETNVVVFFLTGILYYAKQFTSTIIVLFCLYFFFKKFYKFGLIIGFGIALKEISYVFIFKNLIKSHHLSQIDIKDTIFDLILLRDLDLFNIILIVDNLAKDKPMTLLMIVLLISVFSLLIKKKLNYSLSFLITIFFVNMLFVFILYISVWRGMELESPIRFIYTFLLLQLIIIGKSFDLETK